FVRLEVATALRNKVHIIPALVNDAEMPSAADLPEDLRGLAFRNAISIHNDSFNESIHRLIKAIESQKD
ncbi:MAG TPA: hypothetical protein VJZ27_04825, partial [Aggregatilineales bacterium]|nr:hypothetical protein [Aggregatilineales bacterium]